MFFYMDGGSLKGSRTVGGGENTDMEVLLFETDVADSFFDIPSNYTQNGGN